MASQLDKARKNRKNPKQLGKRKHGKAGAFGLQTRGRSTKSRAEAKKLGKSIHRAARAKKKK